MAAVRLMYPLTVTGAADLVLWLIRARTLAPFPDRFQCRARHLNADRVRRLNNADREVREDALVAADVEHTGCDITARRIVSTWSIVEVYYFRSSNCSSQKSILQRHRYKIHSQEILVSVFENSNSCKYSA